MGDFIIKCPNCGKGMIDREEINSVLANIKQMEDSLSTCKTRERIILSQRLSTERTVARKLLHFATEMAIAQQETPILYAELRKHILAKRLMTERELEKLTEESKEIAEAKQAQCDKEIKRIYAEHKYKGENPG